MNNQQLKHRKEENSNADAERGGSNRKHRASVCRHKDCPRVDSQQERSKAEKSVKGSYSGKGDNLPTRMNETANEETASNNPRSALPAGLSKKSLMFFKGQHYERLSHSISQHKFMGYGCLIFVFIFILLEIFKGHQMTNIYLILLLALISGANLWLANYESKELEGMKNG